MKKVLSLLMVALMVISICSCDSNSKKNNRDDDEDENENENDLIESSDVSKDNITDDEDNITEVTEVTEAVLRSYKTAPASDFEYEEEGNGIKINKYIGDDTIVVIPDEIDGKPVTQLKPYIFSNDSTVRGVKIPNTVKELKFTFVNNKNVQAIICEGIEIAGEYTFMNCAELNTLVLGENLKELGVYCIAACQKLEEVYISPNVTVITTTGGSSRAIFYGCPNLTVIGEAGSTIETYVKENGYNFREK